MAVGNKAGTVCLLPIPGARLGERRVRFSQTLLPKQTIRTHSRVKGAEERGSVSRLEANCPPSFSHRSQLKGEEDEKGREEAREGILAETRLLAATEAARQPSALLT